MQLHQVVNHSLYVGGIILMDLGAHAWLAVRIEAPKPVLGGPREVGGEEFVP